MTSKTNVADPDDKVVVELRRPVAELLARLCIELDNDDAGQMVGRALSLLEMCARGKRDGGRLTFVSADGETSDVVF